MRLTERIAAFQLTVNPANNAPLFTHLDMREAMMLRSLGLEAKKRRKPELPTLFDCIRADEIL